MSEFKANNYHPILIQYYHHNVLIDHNHITQVSEVFYENDNSLNRSAIAWNIEVDQ